MTSSPSSPETSPSSSAASPSSPAAYDQLLLVHSYESMGTFDEPGVRYVVFLQGCPFRCLYCANPDTIEPRGEAKPTTADYIVEQAVSMKPFFGARGGVTFSGGEPTKQARALVPVLQRLKAAGLHICLDTNGGLWNDDVEAALRLTDLVLLDVKAFSAEKHRHITGRDNAQTLRTAAWLEENQRPFRLRYVLVPGLNDSDSDLRTLGEHFQRYLMIERVELLPYHTLGVHKYTSMGWEYKLAGTKENTPEQLQRAEQILREYFPQLVVN